MALQKSYLLTTSKAVAVCHAEECVTQQPNSTFDG